MPIGPSAWASFDESAIVSVTRRAPRSLASVSVVFIYESFVQAGLGCKSFRCRRLACLSPRAPALASEVQPSLRSSGVLLGGSAPPPTYFHWIRRRLAPIRDFNPRLSFPLEVSRRG